MTPTATKIQALEDLRPGQQWVCFNENKAPISPVTLKGVSGELVEGNTDWASHQDALKAWKANSRWLKGVGREFVKSQGLTGIDLDDCIDDQGKLSPYAEYVVKLFDSYTEYSPSGRGLHIWVHGELPSNLGSNPKADGDKRTEAYDCMRYFTITGKHLEGTPTTIEPRQEQLDAFHREVTEWRQVAEQPRRPNTTPTTTRQTILGNTPYGLKALDDECAIVATTPKGGRETALNNACLKMGSLIAGNELTQETVERELRDAAQRSGLTDREIDVKFRHSISDGMKTPRSAPVLVELNTSSNGHHGNNGNGSAPDGAEDLHRCGLTDMGNAERLVDRYGQNLRFCHAMNNWLIYPHQGGTHWQEDKSGQAERLAKDTVRHIYREAGSIKGNDKESEARRKALASHAIRSESKKCIRDMLALAQSELPISREKLDTNHWLLNCNNGTINLKTGELQKHNQLDYLTHCLTLNYSPLATCKKWLAFLHRIFDGNKELITFIQRAIGYALTGDTSEECFFLFYGAGRNGKSTLLEIIKAILASYAQSADFKTFLARDNEGIRNDLARMNGKRMVIAKESEKGKHLAEAVIKALTGRDTITARFLHQEYFDFLPTHKLFLATNHKPEIKGTDTGIWRRIHLVPFTVEIPEDQVNKNLRDELLAEEAEGILAWAVQGCLDWQRYGLTAPTAVRKATIEYRNEMDSVTKFLDTQCDFAEGCKVPSTDLIAVYTAWCDGDQPDVKQLRNALKERGCTHGRSTGGRYVWHGIQLKPVESEPSQDKSEPSQDHSEHKSEHSEPSEPKRGKFVAKDKNNGNYRDSGSLGSLPSLSELETTQKSEPTFTQPATSETCGIADCYQPVVGRAYYCDFHQHGGVA